MSGQHCESYDVKRETVHCYPVNSSLLTAVARNGWNLSAVFKFCFCFVLLYNKSLNDWSLGEQWLLFPSNLNVSLDFVSGSIEILGKQNSLFPSGPVIQCLLLIVLVSLGPLGFFRLGFLSFGSFAFLILQHFAKWPTLWHFWDSLSLHFVLRGIACLPECVLSCDICSISSLQFSLGRNLILLSILPLVVWVLNYRITGPVFEVFYVKRLGSSPVRLSV